MIEICAIIRNEDEYLQEWIDYHLALGFDRIVLYDNGSSPPLSKHFKYGNDKVFATVWKTDHDQLQCYRHHAKVTSADWTAFIDADEFIRLKNHTNIHEFIDSYLPDTGAITIHWICYGANGHRTKPLAGIQESYTKPCPDPVSDHFKTIARPKSVLEFPDPHRCRLVAGQITDVPMDIAHIDHYFTKSFEEWQRKIERGRADSNQKRTIDEFYHYNPEMKL